MPQSASTFRTNRRASATAGAADGKVADAVCRSNCRPSFESVTTGLAIVTDREAARPRVGEPEAEPCARPGEPARGDSGLGIAARHNTTDRNTKATGEDARSLPSVHLARAEDVRSSCGDVEYSCGQEAPEKESAPSGDPGSGYPTIAGQEDEEHAAYRVSCPPRRRVPRHHPPLQRRRPRAAAQGAGRRPRREGEVGTERAGRGRRGRGRGDPGGDPAEQPRAGVGA